MSGDKPGGRDDDPKKQALASIQRQVPQLVDMAGRIWEFAETALREHRSVEVLAEYAERHGFEVERGIADLPTASGERN